MARFLSDFVKSITPYTAGEQLSDKKYIKLNTNENAYPPAPEVCRAIKDFDFSSLRLYPDPNSRALKEKISQKENLSTDNIFVGNGSDEVLAFCFPAYFSGKKVYFADITYSFYPVYCNFFKIDFENVQLRQDFSLNVEDYFTQKDCGGIIIANPNAPTGKAISLSNIEKLLQNRCESLVIIDEAYVDFFGQSAAQFVEKYDNLVVVKTFSKGYSLAGIRCGYALANKELIKGLEICRDSFNSYPIDRLCQTAAIAALDAQNYYDQVNLKIISQRQKLRVALEEMGMTVLESGANFLFASHQKGGEYLYRKLKERAVLVRYFKKERIENFIRITVGTPSDNDILLKALKEILQQTR